MSQLKAAEDMFAVRTRSLEIAALEISRSHSNEPRRATLPEERRWKKKEERNAKFSLKILLIRIATSRRRAWWCGGDVEQTPLDSARLLLVFCYIRITFCECAILDAILNERLGAGIRIRCVCKALRIGVMLLDSKFNADWKFVGDNLQLFPFHKELSRLCSV